MPPDTDPKFMSGDEWRLYREQIYEAARRQRRLSDTELAEFWRDSPADPTPRKEQPAPHITCSGFWDDLGPMGSIIVITIILISLFSLFGGTTP